MTYRHLREWRRRPDVHPQRAGRHAHLERGARRARRTHAAEVRRARRRSSSTPWASRPILGRGFEAADDAERAPPVIVLNHDTWMRRFGGDPAIVGQSLRLDGDAGRRSSASCRAGSTFRTARNTGSRRCRILTGGGPKPNLTNLDTVGVFYVVGRVRPGLDAAAAAREIDETREAARRGAARPAEVGRSRRRRVVPRARLRRGAAGAVDALGGGRRAAADRLRERLRSAAHARLAAAARAESASRARRVARPARAAVAARSRRADASPVALIGLAVGHGTGVGHLGACAG